LGRVDDAIAHAEHAIERDAAKSLSHALLAEAKRARGDLPGARRAIETAAAIDEADPYVRNERAILAIAAGDVAGALAEWQKLLQTHALHAAAFTNLVGVALERADGPLAQLVVDHALAVRAHAPIEMLRRAIQVALAVEPQSLSRGSRIASLCRAVIEREPKDAVAALLLIRALAEMGERDGALERLAALEHAARGTLVAAEAARVRLHVEEPLAAAAIDASMRAAAATDADAVALESVAARARRLGEEHGSWVAHLSAGVAERRLGRHTRARVDTLRALALAPSAPLAHLEMAVLLLATKDAREAVTHARRAVALDPSAARAHAVLAESLFEAGDRDEALASAEHAHAMAPDEEAITALRDRIASDEKKPSSWIDRLLGR
jgi:tetratricopeptide (TPR) repeat protein